MTRAVGAVIVGAGSKLGVSNTWPSCDSCIGATIPIYCTLYFKDIKPSCADITVPPLVIVQNIIDVQFKKYSVICQTICTIITAYIFRRYRGRNSHPEVQDCSETVTRRLEIFFDANWVLLM
jgi:hypothetical protein